MIAEFVQIRSSLWVVRVGEEEVKQIARATEEVTRCMTKAMMAGQTTP